MNLSDLLTTSTRHSEDCIFCRIISGKEEGTFLYRNSKVSAFLDIHPLFEGHTLIVPNDHYVDITDVPKDSLSEVMSVAQMIGKIMIKNLNAEGINILHSTGSPAGQTIWHFHVHVLPRRAGDDSGFQKWWFSRTHKATREELENLAIKLTDK